jgi:multimeric flavodoxin WrbA
VEADGLVFGFLTWYGMISEQFAFLNGTGGFCRTQSLAGETCRQYS